MATVFERVKSIVAERLSVVDEGKVTLQASFVDDLNADSLDLVELIMAIEEEFGKDKEEMTISDEDAEKLTTVQELIDYLKELGIQDQ